ncbi:MAG: transcriptional regulator NrdR [Thermincolia bacterium]
MRCPFCNEGESKVLDSRSTEDGRAIRRRRECLSCAKRFTTYEKVDEIPLVVVKKDGKREVFDRSKLLGGVIKACEKRPITMSQMEQLVDSVERDLRNSMNPEVTSDEIGEIVMEGLKELDQVAYVRFASVYRQFKDVGNFIQELEKLLKS